MEIREIRVECQKMVSDGAYGNERLTVGLTVSLGENETPREALTWAQSLVDQAYDIVLERLKRSISAGIRDSLETRAEREARWEEERQALREAQTHREERRGE